MDVHSLTVNYGSLKNCIVSNVVVSDSLSAKKIGTIGIWDTGATNSVITKTLAQELGLISISKVNVTGVHGTKEVDVYYVSVTLHNENITVKIRVSECESLSPNGEIGMLIGMDIINMGDFVISNHQGKTSMSFRVPSIQRIDFVDAMRAGKPIVTGRLPSRNDLCPCSSGKKYKRCCGK